MQNGSSRSGNNVELLSLFSVILKKIWIVIILSVVLAAGGFAYSYYTYVPQYTSTASLISNNRQSNATNNATAGDLQVSQELINTFSYVIESNTVVNRAIELADINVSAKRVKEMIDINTYTGNNIMEISITNSDPEVAYKLADAFCRLADGTEPIEFKDEIQENGSTEQVPVYLDDKVEMGALNTIDYPLKAEAPDSDNSTARNTILGFGLGIALACFIIIINEYMKNTARTAQDIINRLDMNLLGSIPLVEKNKKRTEYDNLITNPRNGFEYIETYKAIRTKIETYTRRNNGNRLLISSTLQNEGKSTVAANIALALAQNGKSVALIDADLRNPSIDKIFKIEQDEHAGVFQIAEQKKSWRSCVKTSVEYENISFIFSGCSGLDESAEILSSQNLADEIEDISKNFDFVIIDTPPIHVLTDPIVMSNNVDAVIMVVKQDVAKMADIERAVSDITENCPKLVGCVFNGVSAGITDGYRKGVKYGKYGYYYGYNSYYGYKSRNSAAKKGENKK